MLLLEHVGVLRLGLGVALNDGTMSGWLTDEEESVKGESQWQWKSSWWRGRAREQLAAVRSQRHLVGAPAPPSEEGGGADASSQGEEEAAAGESLASAATLEDPGSAGRGPGLSSETAGDGGGTRGDEPPCVVHVQTGAEGPGTPMLVQQLPADGSSGVTREEVLPGEK